MKCVSFLFASYINESPCSIGSWGDIAVKWLRMTCGSSERSLQFHEVATYDVRPVVKLVDTAISWPDASLALVMSKMCRMELMTMNSVFSARSLPGHILEFEVGPSV